MKSFTSIVILCFFASATLVAQRGDRAKKEERIQSLRVAFITDKLQLTPKESEQFWPIYNEYGKEKKKLHRAYRKEKKNADMTDIEAEEMVDASFALQEQQLALKRTYFDRLKKVIPSKKLVLLEKAEKQFREKVIKEIRRRKQQKRRNKN